MRILVAIDGSEYSEEAVRALHARPLPKGSTIRMLSVVPLALPPPPAPAWASASVGYTEFRERQKDDARILVERAADSLRGGDVSLETAVREGDPRAVIVQDAQEWSADLVVMGSRGHSGLKGWLLGSVAQYVVSHAPCSVEVVRKVA